MGKKRLSWVALNLALCPNSLVLRNLLERFTTPDAILAAPAEALSEVSGVTERLLRRLKNPKLQDAARCEIA